MAIENAELTPTEEVRSQLLVSAQWSLEKPLDGSALVELPKELSH